MARQLEKADNPVLGQVVGLTLLGLGTLLFLALISFQPRDVPSWVPIIANSAVVAHLNHNFIGPVGAIVAGIFYFLIGAASYLAALVLLGYGGAKLLAPALKVSRRTPWVIGAIISFACLADIQHFFLVDWKNSMHIPGNGGAFGHWVGHLCYGLLGSIGSVVVLTVVYLTCLVMMTGIHPIQLMRRLIALPGELSEKRRQP